MAATHTDNGPVRAGYWYSPIEVPIPVANIPSENFTHLFASFADVNPTTYEVTFPKGFEVQFSTFTQTVQKRNFEVKTLISIGGDYCRSFPSMVRELETRKSFIDSSIHLARNNNFHGLCLNWLYPSTQDEMNNLGSLLNEWHAAVVQESDWTGTGQLLLVEAVYYRPEHKSLSFPFEAIAKNLDWIDVLAYDYYSPVPSRDVTGPFAALYDGDNSNNEENPAARNRYRCGDFGIRRWLETIVPPNKIVLGLPFYGYAWRLQDGNIDRELFAPADGPADGEANGVFINPLDGTIFYNQIRHFIDSHSDVETNFKIAYVVNYCSAGNTWIGYNDVKSIQEKVKYARGKGLRGYYAWHVGADREGTLSTAAKQAWPDPEGARQAR